MKATVTNASGVHFTGIKPTADVRTCVHWAFASTHSSGLLSSSLLRQLECTSHAYLRKAFQMRPQPLTYSRRCVDGTCTKLIMLTTGQNTLPPRKVFTKFVRSFSIPPANPRPSNTPIVVKNTPAHKQ